MEFAKRFLKFKINFSLIIAINFVLRSQINRKQINSVQNEMLIWHTVPHHIKQMYCVLFSKLNVCSFIFPKT